MPDLLDSQRAFARALREPGLSPEAARGFIGDAGLVERRFSVYKANVSAAATKALRAAYPVVQQLVGEEFFGGLAREYLRECASTSGDLFDFGAEFAGFLRHFPHTRSLAYLPDLAQLEWRVHRAYGAKDAERFDIASLAQVPAEQWSAISLQWAEGTSLFDSAYPIVQLWQIHQAGFEGEFAVDWSAGECACVARDGFEVVVSAIGAADAAFLAASLAGASLEASCAAAIALDAGFDPGQLLARAVASNLVTGFIPASNERTS